jgi:hypothetical protein
MTFGQFTHSISRLFRKPTAAEKAAQLLADAELARIDYQNTAEWAAAMVSYEDQKIRRLRGYLKSVGTESAASN